MIAFENFIDGQRMPSDGTQRFEVRSPYDGAPAGSVAAATRGDVDRAVMAARRAFDSGPWQHETPAHRQSVLRRFAELHAARAEEFARFISRENGSSLMFTMAVQQGIAPQNEAYLRAAADYPWEAKRPGLPMGETLWRSVPVGVVAVVIPWNAPHQAALAKLFPALLAGCSVVLKLAPETGLDGHFLGELFTEAGLPSGVLNIVTADRDTSEFLVSHPGIDKVAFTGSTLAGRRIASLAGNDLRRVSLELGGKSAAVVLPDTDLTAAVPSLGFMSMLNSGQSCIALTRLLVPSSMHDRFVEAYVSAVSAMKVGDPLAPDTFFGPLVAPRQQQRVWEYIEAGIAEGATLAFGGLGMPAGITQGAFVRPTVFSNVKNSMRIAREEIFGPVVTILPYDSVDDAVVIANDSPYGLSGAVWSSDHDIAVRVAARLRTGTVAVNGRIPDFLAPFGGFKQSGLGREFGSVGLSHYVEQQAIYL